MNISLIIFSVFLAVFLIFWFSHAKIVVKYDNDFKVYFKLLFIKISLIDSKKTKKKKKKKSSAPDLKTLTGDRGVFDSIKLAIDAVRNAGFSLSICDFCLDCSVGTSDAAQTALLCGSLYALIYNALGTLNRMVFVNKPIVSINPDYNGQTFKVKFNTVIKGQTGALIISFISLFLFLKKQNNTIGKEDENVG